MSISLRSVRTIMLEVTGNKRLSKGAIELVIRHLDGTARGLVLHASRIHDRENILRKQVGERPKVILAEKHLKQALEGQFPELRTKDYDDSQS